jgi:hypothetical protein
MPSILPLKSSRLGLPGDFNQSNRFEVGCVVVHWKKCQQINNHRE